LSGAAHPDSGKGKVIGEAGEGDWSLLILGFGGDVAVGEFQIGETVAGVLVPG
jgi:hypothetical protein